MSFFQSLISCLRPRRRAREQRILWRNARRAIIDELLPAYEALGKTKDVQDLIFRLWPEQGVMPEDAWHVLGELDRKLAAQQVHDFKSSVEGRIAVRRARDELIAFHARA